MRSVRDLSGSACRRAEKQSLLLFRPWGVFTMRTSSGGPFCAWERELLPHIDRWELVEEGPVLAILEGYGSYRKVFGEEPSRVTVRLSFTAGKPWIDLGLRLFNDSMGGPGTGCLAFSDSAGSRHGIFRPSCRLFLCRRT